MKYLKLIGASLAAMIAGAKFPATLTAEIDAAAKDRKATLPAVVRFATILRRHEAKARGASLERIRTARHLASNEAAKLGFVA